MRKKSIKAALIVLLCAALCLSIAQNIYYAFWGFDSYLQSTDEIYIMEAGILTAHETFMPGEKLTFSYDMEHEEYPLLREKYNVEKQAGEGSEWQKAARLMDAYARRLTHKSNYDNHVPMNAMDLLAYSLDNKEQGINCRAKAQILNEMCLSLGLYTRKVWIMPLSPYDHDCHVVNEVWDSSLNKWVMLDITNNQYWVDEEGTPLSVLEIRQKGADQAFCTPVCPGDDMKDLQKLQEKYMGNFVYIMKNMVYTEYCAEYGVGETKPFYLLFPESLETEYEYIIDLTSVNCAPY